MGIWNWSCEEVFMSVTEMLSMTERSVNSDKETRSPNQSRRKMD